MHFNRVRCLAYDQLNLVHPFHQVAKGPAGAMAPRKVADWSKKVSPANLGSVKLPPVSIYWLPFDPAKGVGSGAE